MAQFIFVAHDKDGKRVSGILESQDREAALKMLSDKDYIVTKLNPILRKTGILGWFSGSIRKEEILLFTQELGAMLAAGLSIVHALNVIASDIVNLRFRSIVGELANNLSAGRSLSESLQKYESLFSKLYVSMVKAGEASGKLPDILERLGQYIENSETLRRKVQAAFYYPAIVIGFAIVVVTFIFIFGIPQLQKIYAGLDANLPFLTQVLMNMANFVSHYWLIMLAVLILIILILRSYLRTAPGKLLLDHILLHGPLIGPLFQKLAIARFSSTLEALYTSGVPIIQSLTIVSGATGNKLMELAVENAMKSLKEGQSIVEPLRKSGVFTNLAISMISAGEESGKLDLMLRKVASFYETQVDITLKTLAGLIEPIIMIFVGFLIAFIIFALAIPFMNLSSLLMH